MNSLKKTISFVLIMCMLLLPMSIVSSATTLVEYVVEQTYTVAIPEYIEATPQTETEIQYEVKAENVIIQYNCYLNVSVNFDKQLVHIDDNSISIDYEMNNVYSETIDKINSGEIILSVPFGNVEGDSTNVYAKLTSEVNYAGVYTDTVTFSSKVSEETNYSTEEIENNPLLFGIGETKPEYVVATFNEDYTEVTITKNGEDSDGRMMDWVNSDALKCPMIIHNKTMQKATVEEGVVNLGVNSFNAGNISKGVLKTVSLPSTLKEIELNSFRNQGLVSLELPANLETIGQRAFSNCNKIAGNLIIPDSVVSIGHFAFEKCVGFDGALVIGDGTRFIGNGAFTGDTNTVMKFTSLDLGESVEYIGFNAFQVCHYISNEIVFPDTLKVIGDFAFNHCSGVANETLVIPASVEVIGGIYNPNASSNTTNLENYMDITVYETGSHNFYDFGVTGFKEFVVEDGNKAFKDIDGVLYSKDGKRLVSYPACKEGTSYEIPEGVEYIDELAFDCSRGNATNYLKTLTLPDSYTIKKYGEHNPSIINYENSLVNALYIASGVEEVLVKDTNTQYQSIDGCLYSKDGTVCWYIPAYKNTVNIIDGCTTLEGAYYNPYVIKPDKSNVYVINIPASLTTISVYNDTYNTIAYMNEMIDNYRFDLTINVDANNPAYTVDANGYLVTK